MDETRFHRLSPRHRDCLRLTFAHRTTKEIARELGIGAGTVNGYLTEAIAILGARNRRDAAILLHDHELHDHGAPTVLQGQSVGVAVTTPPPPSLPPTSRSASRGGPLDPDNWEADNELGIVTRLGWILALAVALAIGFGALAAGVRTFSDLFGADGRGVESRGRS